MVCPMSMNDPTKVVMVETCETGVARSPDEQAKVCLAGLSVFAHVGAGVNFYGQALGGDSKTTCEPIEAGQEKPRIIAHPNSRHLYLI